MTEPRGASVVVVGGGVTGLSAAWWLARAGVDVLVLEAGIVGRRKQGNHAYYAIVDESVFAMCEQVCGSIQRQLAELNALVEGAGR